MIRVIPLDETVRHSISEIIYVYGVGAVIYSSSWAPDRSHSKWWKIIAICPDTDQLSLARLDDGYISGIRYTAMLNFTFYVKEIHINES